MLLGSKSLLLLARSYHYLHNSASDSPGIIGIPMLRPKSGPQHALVSSPTFPRARSICRTKSCENRLCTVITLPLSLSGRHSSMEITTTFDIAALHFGFWPIPSPSGRTWRQTDNQNTKFSYKGLISCHPFTSWWWLEHFRIIASGF